MTDQIFTNARIILETEEILGTLTVKDNLIHDISEGKSSVSAAMDMEGDILMPGMVELHTDNLEKHMTPRPKTQWPSVAAVIAHDNQITSAGITTVFDAVAVGDVKGDSDRVLRLKDMLEGIIEAQENNLLQADHLLHLRIEVSYSKVQEMLLKLVDNDLLRMFSIMDHTPGQRQFVNLDAYYTYYQGKYGLTDQEMEEFIAEKKEDQRLYSDMNRRFVVDLAHERKVALASHDDATKGHVDEAVKDRMTVAEFPTTVEAAECSHAAGLGVMMGGPNLVRGGSHSGNVSAAELAGKGCLDIISSDYVPHSLLHGCMLLHKAHGFKLPDAVATVTRNPAQCVGLDDRGTLQPGKRADLLRIHPSIHHPLIRGVWREGRRVA